MRPNFRIDPCLLMVTGFIIIVCSFWFPWASIPGLDGMTRVTGISFISDVMGTMDVGYYYAPAVLMMASLFALLPVFSRKFLTDSEMHSSLIAAVLGLVSAVLMILMGSAVPELGSELVKVSCEFGVYIGATGAILVMIGGVLDFLALYNGKERTETSTADVPPQTHAAFGRTETEKAEGEPAEERKIYERPGNP